MFSLLTGLLQKPSRRLDTGLRIIGVKRPYEGIYESFKKRTQWKIENSILAKAQKLIAKLPRENSPENKMKAIILIIKLMMVVIFLRCVAKYFQAYIAEKIVQITVTNLRKDVFSHVLNMPLGYFTNERPSNTMSRIVKDTSDMAHALKIMLGKAIREPLNSMVALSKQPNKPLPMSLFRHYPTATTHSLANKGPA